MRLGVVGFDTFKLIDLARFHEGTFPAEIKYNAKFLFNSDAIGIL